MADRVRCIMMHFNPRDFRSSYYGWFTHKSQICEHNEECHNCPILKEHKRERDQREKRR